MGREFWYDVRNKSGGSACDPGSLRLCVCLCGAERGGASAGREEDPQGGVFVTYPGRR
jgi:hypothetical protein